MATGIATGVDIKTSRKNIFYALLQSIALKSSLIAAFLNLLRMCSQLETLNVTVIIVAAYSYAASPRS